MRTRLATPALLLALAACATTAPQHRVADRGMETPHQPVVDATGAHVPDCPNWSNAGGQAMEGQSSNYGCATMSNLAAMVAEPGDLLHGRSDGPNSSSDVALKAVKTWHDLPATSKLWTTTTTTSTTGGAPK